MATHPKVLNHFSRYMTAELNVGSGGLGMGWWKAWVFPYCFFLTLPRPLSDGVPHEAPLDLGGLQPLKALSFSRLPAHMSFLFSHLCAPLPHSQQNRNGLNALSQEKLRPTETNQLAHRPPEDPATWTQSFCSQTGVRAENALHLAVGDPGSPGQRPASESRNEQESLSPPSPLFPPEVFPVKKAAGEGTAAAPAVPPGCSVAQIPRLPRGIRRREF